MGIIFNLTNSPPMPIWKQISILHLEKNKSDLDMNKMFRSGAVKSGKLYWVLEIERNGDDVKVLAQLEPGFEEYVVFDQVDYDPIPAMQRMRV